MKTYETLERIMAQKKVMQTYYTLAWSISILPFPKDWKNTK